MCTDVLPQGARRRAHAKHNTSFSQTRTTAATGHPRSDTCMAFLQPQAQSLLITPEARAARRCVGRRGAAAAEPLRGT